MSFLVSTYSSDGADWYSFSHRWFLPPVEAEQMIKASF